MDSFSGKLIMVTGGATGIGAAIVERFAVAGADVACCYNKSIEAAQSLADRLKRMGTDIIPVKLDVTDGRRVGDTVGSIEDHFSRPVSVLVNNAGDVVRTALVDEMDEDLWNLVISTNLTSAFLCSKYCIPGMKKAGWGRIINISSISARSGGGPGASHYAASKAGLESLTRSLAKELAPHNIVVNGVSPGVIHTAIHERHNTPESLENLRRAMPLQRIGAADDVAGVVAFLASDDASYVTGEIIAVNGGMRMD